MAKYSDIRTAVLDQWSRPEGQDVRYHIKGAPGGGKSDLSRDIVKSHGIPVEDTVELTLSLYDTPDLLGLPDLSGDCSKWKPPFHLAKLAADSFNRKVAMILEEYTDASAPVFNVSCQLLLNNRIGELRFGDGLHIVANGNRTKDKSGANRMPTKAANRLRIKEYETDLNDWCMWALDHSMDVFLIQFLRFKPNLLHNFEPDRETNPTPRAWARVNQINHELPPNIFFDEVRGDVGEGAAAEYIAFRKIASKLPDVESVLLAPDKIDIPNEPSVLYALTGAIAHATTKDNFDRVAKFVARLKPEFQVMCLKDAQILKPEIKQTKAYAEWAVKHGSILL